MSPGARLFALVAALIVVPAAAADPVSAGAGYPDAITVTAARLTPEALHARATEFVHATGVVSGEIPAARWTDPVCPHVVGITDVAAVQVVETTLRRVAADAGIAVAPAPCTANIAVVFAADGGAVVRDLVARNAARFRGLAPAAVAALEHGAAPVRWWYNSEVRDKDGSPATRVPPPALGFGAAPLPQNEDTTFVQHSNTSLISTEDVRTLRAATVVVDVTRTDGLPLSAVASYAAMVALAEIRPGAAPPDSVLGLFGGGPVVRSPTAWDLAFLRALYRLPLDRAAMRQRGLLVADLVTGLTR